MSFNWEVYRELNPDLEKAGLKTRQDFESHYLVHGRNERRNTNIYQAYPDFKPDIYKDNYPDLQNMNNQELELHWLVYGRNENRYYTNYNYYITGIDKIYWINLDSSINRNKHMRNILSLISIQNERIRASDGKMDKTMMNNIVVNTIDRSPGEYGCLLSHLRTIQTFWNSGLDKVLIMEDDISFEFSLYWKKSLSSIIDEAPIDWEILMLSYTDINITSAVPLYRDWNDGIYSTVAYVINRKGANKIMNMYKNDKWHINISPHVADYVIYKKCKTYVYKYCYFTTNDLDGSNIHDDHIPVHNNTKKIALGIWKN